MVFSILGNKRFLGEAWFIHVNTASLNCDSDATVGGSLLVGEAYATNARGEALVRKDAERVSPSGFIIMGWPEAIVLWEGVLWEGVL